MVRRVKLHNGKVRFPEWEHHRTGRNNQALTISRRKRVLAGAVLAVAVAAASAAVAVAAPGDGGDEGSQPMFIGGNPPTQNYPGGAYVSLKYDAPAYGRTNWHTCGATLVFGNRIVTNAHCVTDMPAGADRASLAMRYDLDATSAAIPTADKSFWVRVGSKNKDKGGETAKATVLWVGKKWDWSGPEDVAVMALDHGVDVQTVPLGAGPAQPGDMVYGLGWGLVNPDWTDPLPSMVQELHMPVLPTTSCEWISPRDICVGNVNGTDGACSGDSGGPVLKKVAGVWRLFGGTSRSVSEFCGEAPVTYTSTPEFRDEIYAAAKLTPPQALSVPPKNTTQPVPVG
jgi:hypothetical protein